MRFVSPETTRLDLPTGDWIEVKTELSALEDKRYRTTGYRRVSQTGEFEVDWSIVAASRLSTYLVDWSAKDAKGKKIPVSREAITALCDEDFEAIDLAILAHIAARVEEKKRASVTTTSDSLSTASV